MRPSGHRKTTWPRRPAPWPESTPVRRVLFSRPSPAHAAPSRAARKTSYQLNMRRPEELVYRGHRTKPVAAIDQNGGVAGKTGGIAGHIGDCRNLAFGQLGRLGLGPRARWVQHHGV